MTSPSADDPHDLLRLIGADHTVRVIHPIEDVDGLPLGVETEIVTGTVLAVLNPATAHPQLLIIEDEGDES